MYEELTWYLPILRKTRDKKYLDQFRDAVRKFVNANEETFDENSSRPDTPDPDGRKTAALIAAAVRDGDEAFTDGSVIRWLTHLNEIDIRNARRDMIMLSVQSSSGYVSAEHAYRDEVIVTRDRIRYYYEPRIPSDINPARKFACRLTEPEQREIYEELVSSVNEILHRGAASGMFDIGTRSFTVTYADGTEEKRDFFLPAFAFSDCFRLIKKLIPPDEEIPQGIRTREDDFPEEEG